MPHRVAASGNSNYYRMLQTLICWNFYSVYGEFATVFEGKIGEVGPLRILPCRGRLLALRLDEGIQEAQRRV